MAASLIRLLLAAGLLCFAFSAPALEPELQDPTRPAIGKSSGAGAEAGTGAASETEALPVAVKENLQSIIISPSRRAAVINGVTVELGEKVGAATLIEVRESSVVLQSGQGTHVMELFPGVRLEKAGAATPGEEKPSVLEAKKTKASARVASAQSSKDKRGRK